MVRTQSSSKVAGKLLVQGFDEPKRSTSCMEPLNRILEITSLVSQVSNLSASEVSPATDIAATGGLAVADPLLHPVQGGDYVRQN